MKTIKIRIKSGFITQIEDIPKDVSVVVYDYDTEGTNGLCLSRDEDKKDCYIYHWDHADTIKEKI